MTRVRPLDALDEVLAGVLARPLRSALTALGTVLGLASLVATLGISRTAGNQIVERFDELRATQVTVTAGDGAGPNALPWRVEDRLDRLNGVVASAGFADVPNPGEVRTAPVVDPTGESSRTVPVVAASHGALATVRGHLRAGRWFDAGHEDRRDRVAVLGADLATELGITRLDRQPGVYVGDLLLTVIGIVDDAPRDPGLLGAVVVPGALAAERFDVTAPERVVAEVELGAAQLIADQAPIALAPNAPDDLDVSAPRDLSSTRDAVTGDVNALFLVLGLISLVIGAIGIANVTLVTVVERTGEIGLRRALAARRWHVAGQFLGESAAVGFLGGVVGATLGLVSIVAVAASRDWTPVLDPWIPLAAPPAGAAVGLVAGLYPALRAARMEPVEALRAGV